MVQPATLMPMASGTSRVGFTDSSGAVAIICTGAQQGLWRTLNSTHLSG